MAQKSPSFLWHMPYCLHAQTGLCAANIAVYLSAEEKCDAVDHMGCNITLPHHVMAWNLVAFCQFIATLLTNSKPNI